MVRIMANQIHYEIAAIGFLLATLVAFCIQKRLRTYRNFIFQILLILAVLVASFDVLGEVWMATGNNSGAFVSVCIYMTYLVLLMTYCVIFSTYILSVIQKLYIILEHKWLNIPYIIGAVACATNPWTHLVCSMNSQGIWLKGILYYPVFIICMVYVLFPIFLVIKKSAGASRKEKVWIYSATLLSFLEVIMQAVNTRSNLLSHTVNCMVVFLGFLFLQNSDYYLDEVTGFFKMHGFEEVARERMIYHKHSSYLVIRIMNYTAMTELYEDFRLTQIQGEMAKFMRKECGKKDFYHIAASTFAVVSSSRQESEDIHRILREKMPKVWRFDGEEFVHDYTYYLVETPEECNSLEELSQRISYARSDHAGHHKPGELIRLTHDTVKIAEEKQRVAELIEEAIMDNSIDIYFQPIFSLEKNRVTSIEVLARLKDKDKKFVNPEFFIHVAEENRTILQLGEQIYRKACIFAKQNHIFDLGIDDININLSPVQCCHEELAVDLIRIAGEYDIPMSRMHLEITESDIMDKDEIMMTLESLRSSGAKIALDDFGTGYSSMTSIINLPIDYVKIDKSLVWSYGRGENRYLNQLVPMIHSEGKRIISEGIETQEHIDIFRRLGGDFLQGYYYSKPLPEQEFIQYLKKANHIEEA